MKSVCGKMGKSAVLSAMVALLAVLVALLPVTPALAAGTWTSQRASLEESNFNDVYFLPGGATGWAVGSPSTDVATFCHHCWHTTDSGATWNPQTIGNWAAIPALMMAEMEGVYFSNATDGYAVGQMGFISKTFNGGALWTVVRGGTSEEVLQDVIIYDPANAMVVGVNVPNPADQSTWSPIVLQTSDGGFTWDSVDLYDTSFHDTNNGWAVGEGGAIINTSNGGATWTAQASGTTSDLNAVYATSANDAWVAGDGGTLLHTVDGGVNWSSDFDTGGVFSLDATHTWVAGNGGLILFYDGTSWTRQTSGTTSDLNGVHFSVDTGIYYGWAVGDGNALLYSNDGGASWTGYPDLAVDYNDVYTMISGASMDIWAVGDSGTVSYQNFAIAGLPGGWTNPVAGPPVEDLLGIEFETTTSGQVAGGNGTIAKTGDGGANWTNGTGLGTTNFTGVSYGGMSNYWFACAEDGGLWQTREGTTWSPMVLYDAAKPDANTEYYVGGAGAILKRTSGTFEVQDSQTGFDVNAVEFPPGDPNFGWAVGGSGGGSYTFYTIDGGTNWTNAVGAPVVDFQDVSVIEDSGSPGDYYICAVGDSGTIRHNTYTAPGPPSGWTAPAWAPGGAPNLYAVDFLTADIGWALGDNGTVWQTVDGTSVNPTWTEVDLNDVYSVDSTHTWFVGDGGTVLFYDEFDFEIQYNTTAWTVQDLNSVHFVDANNGYAVGDAGIIVNTTDGGTNWTIQPSGTGSDLNAIYLTDVNSGIAVGDAGTYLRLIGGAWDPPGVVGGANPDLYGVQMNAVGTDGWTVGGIGGNGYRIDISTFTTAPVFTPLPLDAGIGIWYGISMNNPDNGTEDGYVVGTNGNYYRISGGSWDPGPGVVAGNPDLYGVQMLGNDDGWAVGGTGTPGYRVQIQPGPVLTPTSIADTSNFTGISLFGGGVGGFYSGEDRGVWSYNSVGPTWTALSNLSGAGTFYGFDLAATDDGWAVGAGGQAYDFQGGTFLSRSTGTAEDLNAASTLHVNNAWAVGNSGDIVYFDGSSWSAQTSWTSNDLYGVEFSSPTNGCAAGAGRTTIETSNGGTIWSVNSGVEPTTDDFLGIDFTSYTDGWICGEGGKLYRYEDGKVNLLTSGTGLDLKSISMYGAGGFAAGVDRAVLESANGTDWTVLSSLDVTDGINGASFTATHEGWFAGDNGLILHYDNGLFETQDVGGTSQDYRDISLVDNAGNDVGAAVGTNSTVRYTADNGATWSGASGVPLSTEINGVEFASTTEGLFCGDDGVVYNSTDGGASWVAPTTPPGSSEDLLGVTFGDAVNNYAWAVGTGGVIYRSMDQGDVWAVQTSNTVQDLYGAEAIFVGPDYTCWAVGNGRTIMNTADSGTTWAAQSEVPRPGGLFGVDVTPGGTTYASGFTTILGGIVVNTANSGVTFNVDVPGTLPLYAIDCYANNQMWAAGGMPGAGVLLHGDGLGNWTPPPAPLPAATEELAGVYSDFNGVTYDIIAVGTNGYVASSIDSGVTWMSVTSSNKNDLSGAWYEYVGPGAGTGYAVGDDGTIINTLNQGANWALQLGPANRLHDTGFYDELHGWCVGTKGTIIFTGDGGVTWNTQDSTVYDDLRAISVLDGSNAWAVGENGTILFYDSGGGTWGLQVSGVTDDLYGVYALSPTNIWAVGVVDNTSPTADDGIVLHNDGTGWSPEDTATGKPLNDVFSSDATHIWAVGAVDNPDPANDDGVVRFSGGSGWSDQNTVTGAPLYGVCAADASHVWAVGDSGTIVNTTDGGTSWGTQTSGVGATLLYDVQFGDRSRTDLRDGWIVGEYAPPTQEGTILATNDGGDNWYAETSNTGIGKQLRGLDLAWDVGTTSWVGYAVGDWGRVQKHTGSMPEPSITPPLVPAQDMVGNPVTISGANFGADQATVNGHVYFYGGVDAGTATTWNNTTIIVDVPSGAYSGLVHVVNDGGSSSGENFTVEPSISDITPDPMSGGDAVSITGEGFGNDPGAGNRSTASEHVIVYDDTLAVSYQIPDANVTSWSNTQIDFTLPDDVEPGTRVTVTAGSIESATYDGVTVRPRIDDVAPAAGARTGDTVTLTGINFGADPGVGNRATATHNVTINTSTGPQMVPDADVTSWAYNQIQFTVPYNFGLPIRPRSGDVTVTSNTTASAAGTTLTVLPGIDDPGGVSPVEGYVGDTINVDGSCFGDTQGELNGHVYFHNGVEAAVAGGIWNDNAVDVHVPADAVTGNVKVTTDDGDSNELPFTVKPFLGTLSKSMGRVGDEMTITGTGFGPDQGAGTVTFNGVEATVTAWGSASITTTVPEDATSGDIVVTTAGGSTTGENFTVMPKITSIDPDTGVPGDTVITIDGYTFGDTQGNSDVQFAGVSAGTAQSWSRDQIKVKVPGNAASGEVVVSTADGLSNGVFFSVGPRITSIAPNGGPPGIEVTITGENFKVIQGVGKVEFNGLDAGTANSWSETEIKIEVPTGATTGDVVVTTTDGPSNGVPFTVGPANIMYFAEGTTRPGFDQWICIMNPNDEVANVNITYMMSDGSTMPQLVIMEPMSRTTIKVIDAIGPDKDVSTRIASDQPIVAERPIYFNYHGLWPGGHDVVGAVAPAREWYFAEGTTRDGFDEWLCLQNPNDTTVEVEITYMLQGDEVRTQTVEILPTSRETIDVKGFLGPNIDCSAKVTADAGIIAERPMYFNYQGYTALNWPGGHNVMGATSPGTLWYFAEGTTRDGFDEWLCIQNPGLAPALVYINYMLGTGENLVQVEEVGAQKRKTISVAAFLGRGHDVSMTLNSNQPIVAERSMYFNYVGLPGGHDVVGAKAPAIEWYFAEGATQNGFQEWLSIQNPNNEEAEVTITYMLGTGETQDQVITVKPRARETVDVNSAVGWGKDVSARITCSKPIIVERPMYFNYMSKWPGGHDVVGFSW